MGGRQLSQNSVFDLSRALRCERLRANKPLSNHFLQPSGRHVTLLIGENNEVPGFADVRGCCEIDERLLTVGDFVRHVLCDQDVERRK